MSLKNLTPFFIEAQKDASRWSKEELDKILSAIPPLIPDAKIDWDENSGENWCSVSLDKKWIGMIRVDTPIAFFLEEYGEIVFRILSQRNVKLILVPSWSEKGFKLERHQVEQILPGGWQADPDAVNLENLSIADLWYATI